MNNQEIQQALRHLRKADPIMREVIRKAGPFTLQLRRNRFRALVFAILGQQISGKAAASIRARLVDYLKPDALSPQCLARLTIQELRSVGVSPQKAGYLLDLAKRVSSGDVRLNRMARLTDDRVIEELTQ